MRRACPLCLTSLLPSPSQLCTIRSSLLCTTHSGVMYKDCSFEDSIDPAMQLSLLCVAAVFAWSAPAHCLESPKAKNIPMHEQVHVAGHWRCGGALDRRHRLALGRPALVCSGVCTKLWQLLAAGLPGCYLSDLMSLDVLPRWLSLLDGLGEQQSNCATRVLGQPHGFCGVLPTHVLATRMHMLMLANPHQEGTERCACATEHPGGWHGRHHLHWGRHLCGLPSAATRTWSVLCLKTDWSMQSVPANEV